MNGSTTCSGQRGSNLCPLRATCSVYDRYRTHPPDAIYELEPPFIEAQCDHYEQIGIEAK